MLELLADGVIKAQVAARLPLTDAVAAMQLAESGNVTGKVVLVLTWSPQPGPLSLIP